MRMSCYVVVFCRCMYLVCLLNLVICVIAFVIFNIPVYGYVLLFGMCFMDMWHFLVDSLYMYIYIYLLLCGILLCIFMGD